MRPSDVTDGVARCVAVRRTARRGASMRPSDVTDGIRAMLREGVRASERSFNEAVGCYRRNRCLQSPSSAPPAGCFNEAVGCYRRNHPGPPGLPCGEPGFNEAVGCYRRNPVRSRALDEWSMSSFNEAVGCYRRNRSARLDDLGFVDVASMRPSDVTDGIRAEILRHREKAQRLQ